MPTGAIQDLLRPLSDHERKHAPKELFYEGDRSLLKDRVRVSVVGTRKPSSEGSARARVISEALVRHEIVIVSGLAEGIDTIAHRTGMASGGRTIAVLGTPLGNPYPPSNRALFDEIRAKHLVLSQFADGSPSKPTNFPRRNRTMALISDATVIVEAGDNSGSLNQGWEALRLGRLLFLMKSLVENKALAWPREMVGYGAQILSGKDELDEILPEIPRVTAAAELAF
jgi:DNA processing protein